MRRGDSGLVSHHALRRRSGPCIHGFDHDDIVLIQFEGYKAKSSFKATPRRLVLRNGLIAGKPFIFQGPAGPASQYLRMCQTRTFLAYVFIQTKGERFVAWMIFLRLDSEVGGKTGGAGVMHNPSDELIYSDLIGSHFGLPHVSARL